MTTVEKPRKHLLLSSCFCTAVIRIGIVIKTHFVALRTFDPPPLPETHTGFWGDWNLQEWKMTDEVAGVEFAGLENDGLENDGLEND